MLNKRPGPLAVDEDGDCDYVLSSEPWSDVWIRVNNVAVLITTHSDHVTVDLMPHDMQDPVILDTAQTHFKAATELAEAESLILALEE